MVCGANVGDSNCSKPRLDQTQLHLLFRLGYFTVISFGTFEIEKLITGRHRYIVCRTEERKNVIM